MSRRILIVDDSTSILAYQISRALAQADVSAGIEPIYSSEYQRRVNPDNCMVIEARETPPCPDFKKEKDWVVNNKKSYKHKLRKRRR